MLKVTCAFLVTDGKLLITQNGAKSDHPFQWEFPGGKIKKGESYEACIIREIKEELELDIQIIEPLFRVEFDYGIKEILLIPFICTVNSGTLQLNNHINAKWITLYELKDIDFSAADKKLITMEQNIEILKKYIGE